MISADILQIIRSQLTNIRIPTTHSKIYKDECVLSFDSPYSSTGLFINLQTFFSYNVEQYLHNSVITGNKLYLHEQWKQIPTQETEETPILLGIDIIGGFSSSQKFEIQKTHSLVVINSNNESIFIPLSNESLPEYVRTVCQAVIEHQGMKENMQVDTWQADQDMIISKHADNLIQLENGIKISNDPKTWKCELSGDTSNLWLNLSTGYIGGGRRQWDGTGGSGAALKHYEDTGRIFPLCVKLGTITPHGADVWSYDPNEDCLVTVPRLGEYLSHWGIDIMKLEKTELTLGETEVKTNLNHNWNLVQEQGEKFELVSAPGCIGLTNIGSSCYMNVILQTLFAVEEFQDRYYHHANDILQTLFPTQDPTQDPFIQLSKVATALLSDRYVLSPEYLAELQSETKIPMTEEKYTIAPRMFKHLFSKDSRDFSSSKQQDASEYFQFLLKQIQKFERVGLQTRLQLPADQLFSTPTIFEYELEERYECQITNQVKYVTGKQTLANVLELSIPLEAAINQQEIHQHQERKRKLEEQKDDEEKTQTQAQLEDEPKLIIPFQACLDHFFAPTSIELRNPTLQSDTSTPAPLTPAIKTHRFQYFPKYLMVKLARYYVDSSWVLKKIDAEIPVPESLDLTHWKSIGGLQPGEVPMPESGSNNGNQQQSNNTSGPIVPNEEIVAQLTGMGFSLNGSRRAAIATHNIDAEAAMNWVFEHMEDPDFNDPLPTNSNDNNNANNHGSGSAVAIDEDSVMLLTSLGYNDKQCRLALKETNNNPERAADWLFSHTDELDRLLLEDEQGATNQSTQSNSEAGRGTGSGKYQLIGVISHRGRNTDHGHYVCHLLKDGKWIFFNDEKVALTKFPPLSTGFMYLYKSC